MKRILVVEDETLLREIILDILGEEGFEVTGAEDGAVGVQLAKQQVPDLVLCNVTLPELDGYGVLRALRQDSKTAQIPFIFLSAKDTEADRRQGIALGASVFLSKPLATAELLSVIAAQLKS